MRRRSFYAEIFLISFAGILLEISYTRLISFKLFYYYTYLIIGFALLGMGSGAVLVAILPRLQRLPLAALLSKTCLIGAASVVAGYVFIARISLDSFKIWESLAECARLLGVSFALFCSFACIGVAIALLFASRAERIHRLYFADLLGAGSACAVAVPLIALLGPPACILLSSAVLALASAWLARGSAPLLLGTAVVASGLLGAGAVLPGWLPDVVPDKSKALTKVRPQGRLYSRWGPVFRVDVTRSSQGEDVRLIHHDGLLGSTLHRFDGDESGLAHFDQDPRSLPFRVLGSAPSRVLIIGAAGGHEILASLHFGAEHVDAVELNPITVSLLTDIYADYSGRLEENPRVRLVVDEGRSFLSRMRDARYDLIYFVAPDSYSAVNAASSGAFVLSESYLYTKQMIVQSLQHLTRRGIICAQFGEFSYEGKPNRTARYAATARAAFEELGPADFEKHILVATHAEHLVENGKGSLALVTVLLKRQPFSTTEVERLLLATREVPGSVARHAWGRNLDHGPVNRVISLPASQLPRWLDRYPYDVRPVDDDSPFFWNFARFGSVLQGMGRRVPVIDPEDSNGERLLLALLGVAALFASVFLLLPVVVVRGDWAVLPRKATSAVFFASIGLGFMIYEVCLIQKLVLLLGYPTYSLTVTLMSLLIFTGLGSLSTGLYAGQRDRALLALLGGLVVLTSFYQFGLDRVMHGLLGAALSVRIGAALLVTAPLGLILGAFMPLGLSTVARLSDHGSEYVAWGWATNGFFSVIGSVLTTILAMSYGFANVLLAGLAAYCVAVVALRSTGRAV